MNSYELESFEKLEDEITALKERVTELTDQMDGIMAYFYDSLFPFLHREIGEAMFRYKSAPIKILVKEIRI